MKKDNKDFRIILRITNDEKKLIDKCKNKLNITTSDYIRHCIFHNNSNQTSVYAIKIASIATELLHHIEEKYNADEDSTIRELVAKLWKSL